MSLFRISSYRRQFEEKTWIPSPIINPGCAWQYQSVISGGAALNSKVPNFEVSRALTHESLSRCMRDRTLIADLNDRLVRLIETARCLEEENQLLEGEVFEMQKKLKSHDAFSTTPSRHTMLDLNDVIERLQAEKEEILCNISAQQKPLQAWHDKYEQLLHQRHLLEEEHEDIAVQLDFLTAECLALQDQVGIYEEQRRRMENKHNQLVEALTVPVSDVPEVKVEFPAPDATDDVLNIKSYYSELAADLQFEMKPSVLIQDKEHKKPDTINREMKGMKSVPDINNIRKLISALENELKSLQICGKKLESEMERKALLHEEEIADLQGNISDLKESKIVLQQEIRGQLEDNGQLLNEKMALDMEIAAYRGLVSQEEEWLCYM
ncbi:non-neuronal cytoplasmic intermediate filament protein [Erpetoichthys calabaricus]|uniref:non-neuronal cytoplasmic intermediate filament protein n=1 Tax=Erpetoichthys calabaricus TaxID=27687 RepID=UPI00223434F2|nr:non-neuronal cytoplasmic intermediate filament protein [Erpetoichthys calabaricus]